jgi:hypothetical protein
MDTAYRDGYRCHALLRFHFNASTEHIISIPNEKDSVQKGSNITNERKEEKKGKKVQNRLLEGTDEQNLVTK